MEYSKDRPAFGIFPRLIDIVPIQIRRWLRYYSQKLLPMQEIQHRLSQRGPHVDAETLIRLDPERAGYFTFCFIRNPYARAVSYYAYQMDKQTVFHPGGLDRLDFGAFVRQGYLQRMPPQSRWVFDRQGNPVMDFIGRLEEIGRDLAVVAEVVGAPVVAENRNGSVHREWQDYYTPTLRALVAEQYREDFVRLGFDERDGRYLHDHQGFCCRPRRGAA